MEYWDCLEVSEIEELLESPEMQFSTLNEFDDQFQHLSSIVALSPHLSDDQEESIVYKSKIIQKNATSHLKRKTPNSTTNIGTLTFEERQSKLQRYREKKKNRVWNKKINYNCRKKVAENRVRVKGRFVTKEQALALQNSHDNDRNFESSE